MLDKNSSLRLKNIIQYYHKTADNFEVFSSSEYKLSILNSLPKTRST